MIDDEDGILCYINNGGYRHRQWLCSGTIVQDTRNN